MGYVTNLRRPWLVLDLETMPIAEIHDYADDLKIDSRLRDPEKIAEARKAALDRVALDVDLARIACIGLWDSAEADPYVMTAQDAREEASIVSIAWEVYRRVVVDRGGVCVTFNGLSFDLPLLMRRAQYLGLPYEPLELNRYRPGAQVDLQQVLSFQGAKPFRSLDFYARRFGIAEAVPDASDGGDMPALIAAGDWDAVVAHNEADVRRTHALAVRLGLIADVLTRADGAA